MNKAQQVGEALGLISGNKHSNQSVWYAGEGLQRILIMMFERGNKLEVNYFCHDELVKHNNGQSLLKDFTTARTNDSLINLAKINLQEVQAKIPALIEKKQSAEAELQQRQANFDKVKEAFQPEQCAIDANKMFKHGFSIEQNFGGNTFSFTINVLTTSKMVEFLEYIKGFDFNS